MLIVFLNPERTIDGEYGLCEGILYIPGKVTSNKSTFYIIVFCNVYCDGAAISIDGTAIIDVQVIHCTCSRSRFAHKAEIRLHKKKSGCSWLTEHPLRVLFFFCYPHPEITLNGQRTVLHAVEYSA